MTEVEDLIDPKEQFDKRDGAARIARAAAGTFPIFEQSVAWYTMVRAIKMAQEETANELRIGIEVTISNYEAAIAAKDELIDRLRTEIELLMKDVDFWRNGRHDAA